MLRACARTPFLLLILAAACLAGRQAVDAAETIELSNPLWSIEVTPATLAVKATPQGKTPIELSAAQRGLGPAGNVAHSAEEATWEFGGKDGSVKMQLAGDALSVCFQSAPGEEVTWPVVGHDRAILAYLLPLDEGSYVPADDATWLSCLAKDSPMSTTEGLSMPFWGLDCNGYTLTYLLTNPFRNQLSFYSHEDSIAVRLTHGFSRRQPDEYGVVIKLGARSPVEPARQYRRWLLEQGQLITLQDKIQRLPAVGKLLGAAHIYLWGDGVSVKMMEQLSAAGLDRLWLGLDSWQGGFRQPQAIRKGKDLGYLVATYDSYDSIHHPQEPDTWETAQFDLRLYETGGVIGRDGQPKRGFQGKGYRLSPIAARPYVEARVARLMKELPEPFNSWFIDCDAYGDLEEDYSPLHPASQEEDMRARLERMAWIRDTYGLVIGSERGAAYAAPVIHFAHGMLTPVFGWGDPDLQKNKASPYYLGGWWPPEGPQIMLRQVPVKPEYRTRYFDPRFRIPLYEMVFHDSLIATHHWQSASLKFRDEAATTELTELLYGLPPLYHLNLEEFARHQDRIRAHYRFFSPVHRELALLPMTDFAWLTPDRLVQRTTFGDRVEMVANFRARDFAYQGLTVPARSILARWREAGLVRTFTPPAS